MIIKTFLKNKPEGKTVFSLSSIAQLSGQEINEKTEKDFITYINYYTKKGDLIRLSKGLYSIDKKYDKYELANQLRTPSYISLYTVLQSEGIVFQPYSSVFCASNRSEIIQMNGDTFIYKKIKNSILLNTMGINYDKPFTIATKERALLDTIYLNGEAHFDNLRRINWRFAKKLNTQVYKNKAITNFINTYSNV